MSALELRVTVAADDREAVGDRLWLLGAVAVVETADGLAAGFATDEDARAAGAALGHSWPATLVVDDGSWRDAWRDGFEPVRVGRVVVHLPGQVPRLTGDAIGIEVEPGPTFGSGAHPTTRLALAAIIQLTGTGQSVLDVGSGSGILAVTAARLGAAPVHAVDTDADARAATAANATANGVEVTVGRGLPTAGAFDVVVANLGGARVVEAIAPGLSRLVAPGGTLVVSGLLAGANHLADDVFAGFAVRQRDDLDGWYCLALTAT